MGALALPAGVRLVERDRVESTNDEARALALAGAPEGTLVWAWSQARGRGSRGRTWVSEPGNLYCSFLLRPARPAAETAQLSFVVAAAVAEAVASLLPKGKPVACKWPNDVLVDGRKVGGILLEAVAGSGSGPMAPAALIVGIGVNVRHAPADAAFPAAALATCGYAAEGVEPLLEAVAQALLHHYARWRREGFVPARADWLARAWGRGETLAAHVGAERLEGRFLDIDEGGALILATAAGPRRIVAGAVFGLGQGA